MDKQSAIKLLDDTFNSDFDLNRYIKFVKELFNNFYVNQKDCTKYIANEYKDYISSFVKIGDYENSKKSIEILVVQLNKTSSRDRARTMQRNFIANWLGKTGKDAALVAFYGDDPQDWRFSFVKMEYRLAEVEPGKVKAVKELTPAKRYSFLVGVNEPNHTCRRQFLELVQHEDINPSIDEIEKAFSIDNVTKEFFSEYKELFLELNESLQNVTKKDAYVRQEFEERNISTVDFAKKLLGQIVFIYFLQKKGWLGVSKDDEGQFKKWGAGPKNFLRRLFDKKIVHYDNFFNDVLEPLFYEALADDRTANHDYYSRFKCKIPFLNGGLFEPINEYNWAGTEIVLDNSVFRKIFETFDRFNFTVKEDEPLEKEVAVDPEMLGKVFENLLEVKDRKSKGAFYTPREIVHYMCQQSLINYIETNSSIPRDEIEKFIQLGDFAIDLIIKEQEQIKKYGKSYVDVNLTIPKSIKENHKPIDKLLRNIKIVDPAVGSGAFPMGMMNEIVKARSILSIYFKEERKDYELKREVIENCLYGVDIEPSAVEITKLRFWLSLVVDELDMRNIKPLPNLDHKIMCGNSLLEEFEGVKLFDEKLLGEVKKDFSHELEQIDNEIGKLNKEKGDIALGKKENNGRSKAIEREIKRLNKKKHELQFGSKEKIKDRSIWDALQHRIKESQKKLSELKKLQKQFFNEQNRNKKKQLREEIDKIEWELIEETLKEQGNEDAMEKLAQYKKNKFKPFFLWKLYFAEVFQRENPGFDVVIANPPYVNIKDIDKNVRKQYEKNYSVVGRQDLYLLFIELGFKIIRDSAVLSFISSNKFLVTKNGQKIREYILNNSSIKKILDVSFCNVFKEASTYPVVYIFQKKLNDKNIVKIAKIDEERLNQGLQKIDDLLFDIEQKTFLDNNDHVINLEDNKESLPIIKKIKKKSVSLDSISDIRNGIIVGDQKKYIISEEDFKERGSPQSYKKVIGGRNVFKWGCRWNKEYVCYDKEKIVAPRDEDFFINPKIMIKDIGLRLSATYDTVNYYCLQTLNVLKILDKKYNYKSLLAVLNSTLLHFYYTYYYSSVHVSGGYHRYRERYIKDYPIKEVSPEQQKPFIQLVDQILSITKDDDYLDNLDKQAKVKRLEKEIDQLVYKLYELTPEEIKIVEEFGERK